RAITQPARASRNQAMMVLMRSAASKLPARMASCDAASIIAPGHTLETGTFDHRRKILLVGEFADGFDEIAVWLAVAGHRIADPRDRVERPCVVKLVEAWHRDFGKLEHHDAAARLEHAVSFLKRDVDARHVPDSERDRVG